MRHSIPNISVAVTMLLASAGCGGAGKDSNGPTPASTTAYVGGFVTALTSGGFSLSLAATTDIAPAFLTAASMAPTSATGNASTVDGTSAKLTGTFDASSGALHMSGGNFSLTGSLAGGVLTGTVTVNSANGSFSGAGASATGAAAKAFCGSYAVAATNEFGWLTLVISPTGVVTGVTGSVNVKSSGGAKLGGTASGTSISLTTSDGGSGSGTISADGASLSGTFTSGGVTGTFQASTGSCGGATGVGSSSTDTTGSNGGSAAVPSTVAGVWQTTSGSPAAMNVALDLTGTTVTGSGAITVNIPSYTGDSFNATTGSFANNTISFSGPLGQNPVGDGSFYYGAISFSGTVANGTTMTGTMTYTPPRTKTQVFAAQTVAGMTLVRGSASQSITP